MIVELWCPQLGNPGAPEGSYRFFLPRMYIVWLDVSSERSKRLLFAFSVR